MKSYLDLLSKETQKLKKKKQQHIFSAFTSVNKWQTYEKYNFAKFFISPASQSKVFLFCEFKNKSLKAFQDSIVVWLSSYPKYPD